MAVATTITQLGFRIRSVRDNVFGILFFCLLTQDEQQKFTHMKYVLDVKQIISFPILQIMRCNSTIKFA